MYLQGIIILEWIFVFMNTTTMIPSGTCQRGNWPLALAFVLTASFCYLSSLKKFPKKLHFTDKIASPTAGLKISTRPLAQEIVKPTWACTNPTLFVAFIKGTRPMASAVKIKFPSL